jgi:hypothetical protein
MNEPTPSPEARRRYDFGAAFAGLVFGVTGVVLLLTRLGTIEIRTDAVLPAVVVGLGFALVLSSVTRPRGG